MIQELRVKMADQDEKVPEEKVASLLQVCEVQNGTKVITHLKKSFFIAVMNLCTLGEEASLLDATFMWTLGQHSNLPLYIDNTTNTHSWHLFALHLHLHYICITQLNMSLYLCLAISMSKFIILSTNLLGLSKHLFSMMCCNTSCRTVTQ